MMNFVKITAILIGCLYMVNAEETAPVELKLKVDSTIFDHFNITRDAKQRIFHSARMGRMVHNFSRELYHSLLDMLSQEPEYKVISELAKTDKFKHDFRTIFPKVASGIKTSEINTLKNLIMDKISTKDINVKVEPHMEHRNFDKYFNRHGIETKNQDFSSEFYDDLVEMFAEHEQYKSLLEIAKTDKFEEDFKSTFAKFLHSVNLKAQDFINEELLKHNISKEELKTAEGLLKQTKIMTEILKSSDMDGQMNNMSMKFYDSLIDMLEGHEQYKSMVEIAKTDKFIEDYKTVFHNASQTFGANQEYHRYNHNAHLQNDMMHRHYNTHGVESKKQNFSSELYDDLVEMFAEHEQYKSLLDIAKTEKFEEDFISTFANSIHSLNKNVQHYINEELLKHSVSKEELNTTEGFLKHSELLNKILNSSHMEGQMNNMSMKFYDSLIDMLEGHEQYKSMVAIAKTDKFIEDYKTVYQKTSQTFGANQEHYRHSHGDDEDNFKRPPLHNYNAPLQNNEMLNYLNRNSLNTRVFDFSKEIYDSLLKMFAENEQYKNLLEIAITAKFEEDLKTVLHNVRQKFISNEEQNQLMIMSKMNAAHPHNHGLEHIHGEDMKLPEASTKDIKERGGPKLNLLMF